MTPADDHEPLPTLADRIQASRRAQFVGRAEELGRFRKALENARDLAVLHVFGPAGVGKTALLHEFEAVASKRKRSLHRRRARIGPQSF